MAAQDAPQLGIEKLPHISPASAPAIFLLKPNDSVAKQNEKLSQHEKALDKANLGTMNLNEFSVDEKSTSKAADEGLPESLIELNKSQDNRAVSQLTYRCRLYLSAHILFSWVFKSGVFTETQAETVLKCRDLVVWSALTSITVFAVALIVELVGLRRNVGSTQSRIVERSRRGLYYRLSEFHLCFAAILLANAGIVDSVEAASGWGLALRLKVWVLVGEALIWGMCALLFEHLFARTAFVIPFITT